MSKLSRRGAGEAASCTRTTGSSVMRAECCRSEPSAGKLEKETPDALRVILTDNTDVSRRLRACGPWRRPAVSSRRTRTRSSRATTWLFAWGFRCASTYTGDRDVGEAFTPGEALGREASEYVLLQVTAASPSEPGVTRGMPRSWPRSCRQSPTRNWRWRCGTALPMN